MSVTIKTAKMKYKNSDGEYVGINAVAETKTAEQIAAIQNAGTQVINDINTRKTQIDNILPSDYTELNNRIDNIIDDTAGEGDTDVVWSAGKTHMTIANAIGADIIDLDKGGYYNIGKDTTTVDIETKTTFASYASKAVACSEGDIFIITAHNANPSRPYAFLSSASETGNIIKKCESKDADIEIAIAPQNSAYIVLNANLGNSNLCVRIRPNNFFYDAIKNNMLQKLLYYKGAAVASAYDNLMAHIVDVGFFAVTSTEISNYTDSPVSRNGVLCNFNQTNSVIIQTYIDNKLNVYIRFVNKSTMVPIMVANYCDENGWIINGRWDRKYIVCFGDSRTWYDGHAYGENTKSEWIGKTCVGYVEQIRRLLNASVRNEGVSGETSLEICDRIRAFNFTNYDAVFMEGGANDTRSSVPKGSLQPIGSTFDTTTVYGAWQSAVEYILTTYPHVKIFMDTPAILWKPTEFDYTIAKIKKDVAELYHIPCLDLYKEAGFNVLNREYYYVDDLTDEQGRRTLVHFNDYGNKVIGEIIAKFIDTH